MKLGLKLLSLILLAGAAFGQTITDSAKVPAGCVQLSHCFTVSANDPQTLLWTNGLSFLEYDPSGSVNYYADNVTTYDLVQAPGTDHSQHYPFSLHTVGHDDADTFSIDMTLAGYKFYESSHGGRGGGGAGWHYVISSWNVTVTIN